MKIRCPKEAIKKYECDECRCDLDAKGYCDLNYCYKDGIAKWTWE